MTKISDAMFRAQLEGKDGGEYENRAFSLMREGLTETLMQQQDPTLSVYADQIVWSRSPVRIDLATLGICNFLI